MSNCTDCNKEFESGTTLFINQAAQPFCQDCSADNGCVEKLDSQCVVYHLDNPSKPNKIDNLGLGNGATAEQIFEAIGNLVANQLNIPFTVEDTSTVDMIATGPALHNVKADVKISAQPSNAIQVKNDGLWSPLADGKVKVNSDDTADYLVNQIAGGTDGIVSLSPFVSTGQLKLQPSIDLVLLMAQLCTLNEFRNCVGNLISASSGTPLVATDSPTVDFTTSGALGHSLTAAVKLSATAGNVLSANSDGLYVPASVTSITGTNGTNVTAGTNVKLGGTIIEHTLFDGSSFDMTFNPRRFFIGNKYSTDSGGLVTNTDAAATRFVVYDQKDITNVGAATSMSINKIVNTTGFALLSGRTVTSSYNSLDLGLNAGATINNSNVFAALLGVVNLNFASGSTITMSTGAGGSPRAVSAVGAVPVLSVFGSTNSGVITHAAAVSAYGPQQTNTGGTFYNHITNFYGVLIHDSREGLMIDSSTITNSFGVMQVGTSDINEFHGQLKYYNGLVNASDQRVKDVQSDYTRGLTEIKQINPVVYKYKTSYQATSQNFVGVLAQAVEGIIPESVGQSQNAGYSDFRFFDQAPLFYALINAVKELAARVEALEAAL